MPCIRNAYSAVKHTVLSLSIGETLTVTGQRNANVHAKVARYHGAKVTMKLRLPVPDERTFHLTRTA